MMKKTTLIKWLAPLFIIMHIHATGDIVVKLTKKYTENPKNLVDLSKNKEVQEIMKDKNATVQQVFNKMIVEARKTLVFGLKNTKNEKYQNIEVKNVRVFCELDSISKASIDNFQYSKMTYEKFIKIKYPGVEKSGNDGQNILNLIFYIPGVYGIYNKEKLTEDLGEVFEITPESIKTRTEEEYQEVKKSANESKDSLEAKNKELAEVQDELNKVQDGLDELNEVKDELTKAQNELKKLYTFTSVVIVLCIGLLIGFLIEAKTVFLGQWLFGSAADEEWEYF